MTVDVMGTHQTYQYFFYFVPQEIRARIGTRKVGRLWKCYKMLL